MRDTLATMFFTRMQKILKFISFFLSLFLSLMHCRAVNDETFNTYLPVSSKTLLVFLSFLVLPKDTRQFIISFSIILFFSLLLCCLGHGRIATEVSRLHCGLRLGGSRRQRFVGRKSF
jgi:hypothetical protein